MQDTFRICLRNFVVLFQKRNYLDFVKKVKKRKRKKRKKENKKKEEEEEGEEEEDEKTNKQTLNIFHAINTKYNIKSWESFPSIK